MSNDLSLTARQGKTEGMALVCVAGIPGAGKSTVYSKLVTLGLGAVGTDEDGLAQWLDKETQLPVPDPKNWHDPVETAGIQYLVCRNRVANCGIRPQITRCTSAAAEAMRRPTGICSTE